MAYVNNSLNNTADEDFLVTTATAGTDRKLSVTNTDNSAAVSAAHVQVTVGGDTSIGDPYTNYLVSGAGTFSVGVDNSDSDNFKITTGASTSAGTTVLQSTSAGSVTIPGVLTIGTAAANALADINIGSAYVGGTNYINTQNSDNTNAASNAFVGALTGGASAGDPYFLSNVSGVKAWAWGTRNSDSQAFHLCANGDLSANTVIKSTTAGAVTKPLQPAFLALKSSTTNGVTGDGTTYQMICDTSVFDQQSNYNHATGVFTAPVTGRYLLGINVNAKNLVSTNTTGNIGIIATSRNFYSQESQWYTISATSDTHTVATTLTFFVDMAASDTAYGVVVVAGTGKTVNLYGNATNLNTSFFGHLVC